MYQGIKQEGKRLIPKKWGCGHETSISCGHGNWQSRLLGIVLRGLHSCMNFLLPLKQIPTHSVLWNDTVSPDSFGGLNQRTTMGSKSRLSKPKSHSTGSRNYPWGLNLTLQFKGKIMRLSVLHPDSSRESHGVPPTFVWWPWPSSQGRMAVHLFHNSISLVPLPPSSPYKHMDPGKSPRWSLYLKVSCSACSTRQRWPLVLEIARMFSGDRIWDNIKTAFPKGTHSYGT